MFPILLVREKFYFHENSFREMNMNTQKNNTRLTKIINMMKRVFPHPTEHTNIFRLTFLMVVSFNIPPLSTLNFYRDNFQYFFSILSAGVKHAKNFTSLPPFLNSSRHACYAGCGLKPTKTYKKAKKHRSSWKSKEWWEMTSYEIWIMSEQICVAIIFMMLSLQLK